MSELVLRWETHDQLMCHSPVLIHAGWEWWRTGRQGFEHSVELTNWGLTLGATWGRVLWSPILDCCPESSTEPDKSASCPPSPETPASASLSNTSDSLSTCSSKVLENTTMSSKYMRQGCKLMSPKQFSINLWNVALHNPKGMQLHS